MNIFLWVLQGLLGLAFVAAGLMHLTQPKEKLRTNAPWVDDFSAGTVKMIGAFEILGGVGIVFPWWTGILPVLTPVAALGLAAIMLGAVVTHVRRKEPPAVVLTLVFGVLAAIVAFGRF